MKLSCYIEKYKSFYRPERFIFSLMRISVEESDIEVYGLIVALKCQNDNCNFFLK